MTSEIGKANRELGKIRHYHSKKIEYWQTKEGKKDMVFWNQYKDVLTRWDKYLKIIERNGNTK